jgi:hypothetical protein
MSKPRTIHTIPSLLARTEEYGGCRLWKGGCANGPTPHVYWNGGMVPVRRLILELSGEKVVGEYLGTSCGDPRCVEPSHIVQRTWAEHASLMAKNSGVGIGRTNRIAKLVAWRHANPIKLDMERARAIRADDRRSMEVAQDYGISRSMVCKIKSGKLWKDTASPFSGLFDRRSA